VTKEDRKQKKGNGVGPLPWERMVSEN